MKRSYRTKPATKETYLDPPRPENTPWDVVQLLSKNRRAFLVTGERAIGKTSFLRCLDEILSSPQKLGTKALWPVLPIHVSCTDHADIGAFYAKVIERGYQRLAEVSKTLSGDSTRGGSGRVHSCNYQAGIGPQALLESWLGDVGSVMAAAAEGAEIMLLIDDADEAGDWGDQLLLDINILLTQPDRFSRFGPARRISFVLASRSDLSDSDTAPFALAGALNTIRLAPVSLPTVSKVATGLELASLSQEIYRLSGGHPWLIQHLIGRVEGSVRNGNPRRERPSLVSAADSFDWGCTFDELFRSADLRVREILSCLCLAEGGLSWEELAQRCPLTDGKLPEEAEVRADAERAIRLGLAFELTPGRYAVGVMIRNQILRATGAIAIERQLILERRAHEDRLRNGLRSAIPFRVTLTDPPDLWCIDGLRTAFVTATSAKSIDLDNNDINDKTKLIKLIEKLRRSITGANDFLRLWNEFADGRTESNQPVLVLRATAEYMKEWVNVPIEFLPYNGAALCRLAAVYREMISDERVAYHLSPPPIDLDNAAVAIVVCSNGGKYSDGREYKRLDGALREAYMIATKMLARQQNGRKAKLTVIADGELDLPSSIRRQLSRGTLDEILREIDVFHYIGHFRQVEHGESGLLIPEAGQIELYNTQRMTRAFGHNPPSLVYLNGCRSGQENQDGSGNIGGATACLLAGVRVVVANRCSVTDSHAAKFSELFYVNLLDGNSPEVALLNARNSITNESGFEDTTVWAAPIMFAQ
jgi:hypothetical protein